MTITLFIANLQCGKTPKDLKYRKIREIDPLSFASNITNPLKKPEHYLDELVCQYSHVLSELLDKHAPLKTQLITVRPEAPWMEESLFFCQQGETPAGTSVEIILAHD